jgi:polyribonucleotide 5'-hydroxyl-kinase
VVELDRSYVERVQQYQLHTYMYGQVFDLPAGILPNALGARGDSGLDLQLSPSSTVVGFDDMKIFRIGESACYSCCTIRKVF